jgi:ribose-phosphate pyrophosphokinase
MATNEPPLVFALTPYRRLAASTAGIERGEATIRRFPNGELNAHVEPFERGRRCAVLASIAPPETHLAHVTLLAHTLRRAGAAHVTAVIPYLAYARQDRADGGESLGLAWAGGLLEASGVGDVITIDVHSRAAPAVLGLPLTSLPPAEALASALPSEWRGDDVTFVAPDQGAIDRCRALADAVASPRPVAVLTKERSASGIVHTELTGELSRRAVIVDDILDTGATLVSCADWLEARGVEASAVVVTHGLFTGSAWLAMRDRGVRRLWTTDTVPGRPGRAGDAEIVAAGPLLAPLLTGRARAETPASSEPRERQTS